jgi:hypothetical protein
VDRAFAEDPADALRQDPRFDELMKKLGLD